MKKNYYNAISPGYNELHQTEQKEKLAEIKKLVNPNKDDILLDVGCGTGVSSGWDCTVIGIDPNIEMIKHNQKEKILGIGENLPFKDKSFDYVCCLTAIHNFKDYKKGLLEIRRVGKKTFIISVLKRSNKSDKIINEIKRLFKVHTLIEEKKDIILIGL